MKLIMLINENKTAKNALFLLKDGDKIQLRNQ